MFYRIYNYLRSCCRSRKVIHHEFFSRVYQGDITAVNNLLQRFDYLHDSLVEAVQICRSIDMCDYILQYLNKDQVQETFVKICDAGKAVLVDTFIKHGASPKEALQSVRNFNLRTLLYSKINVVLK